jgi:tetrahydromethanopterin S-methyltransferase subunit G
MTRYGSRRSASLAMLLVILVIVVAACGSQAGALEEQAQGGDSAALAVPAASAAAGGETRDEASGGGPAAEPPDAAPIEQRIIKTGEVALEVDSVPAILARVRGIADELGGYIGASQAGTLQEGASLTLRVPADRFDELLARLHELEDVEVVSESTTEQDVTRQIVDLEARIRNLQASEESYRVLLERAEEIDDILAVQSRLDQVRGQIEQLTGQLETVEGQADLSTLTVTIIPRGEPVEAVQSTWDPGAELQSALAALVGFGQGVLDALIWFAIVWVPILLVLALIGVFIFRALLEVRRRWPVTPEHHEA